MAADIANVRLGQCDITYKSQALGHTKGGVEITIANDVKTATVDNYGTSPIAARHNGTRVEIKTTLAEYVYASLLKVINGAVDADTGGSVAIGTAAGTELTGGTLLLHPSNAADTTLDITAWKAVIIGESKLPFKVDEETVYEVTWLALCDTTKADGQKLIRFGIPTTV